jgi:hypothetical protein
LKNIRDYKVVKKHYKMVDPDVVLLGFPSNLLDSLVSPDKVEHIGNGHLSLPCERLFEEREYAVWFETIRFEPEKPKKIKPHKTNPQATSSSPGLFHTAAGATAEVTVEAQHMVPPPMTVRVYETAVTGVDAQLADVVGKLESFPLESSTPMQCMMFLSELRSDIKKVRNGGL